MWLKPVGQRPGRSEARTGGWPSTSPGLREALALDTQGPPSWDQGRDQGQRGSLRALLGPHSPCSYPSKKDKISTRFFPFVYLLNFFFK